MIEVDGTELAWVILLRKSLSERRMCNDRNTPNVKSGRCIEVTVEWRWVCAASLLCERLRKKVLEVDLVNPEFSGSSLVGRTTQRR